jgi:predicted GNAT family acetyltransferase/predicted nucleic acid-binding protein
MIKLLSDRNDVLPFVDRVVAASNTQRNSFGFLPKKAYSDFAYQRRIVIAIDESTSEMAGYAIFAGALPTAKLRQTYVDPQWRRKGIGQLLVTEVLRRCEEMTYLSVRATVAEDLTEANGFYESMGFSAVFKKPGGDSRKRTLIVRVRELETPSLLNFAGYGAPNQTEILLRIPDVRSTPLYLIDLNVLFDVTKGRSREAEAGKIFSAAAENEVKIAVSSEFIVELERSTATHGLDPTLQLAKQMSIVKKPGTRLISPLIAELAPVVFPDRNRAGKLTTQDKSDLAHLATAIIENVAGFVTSEKAILRSAETIRERYGIDVVSPAVFASADDDFIASPSPLDIALTDRTITSRQMTDEDHIALQALAEKQGIPNSDLRVALSQGTSRSPRTRVVVRDGNQLVAAATWQMPDRQHRGARLYLFANNEDGAVEIAVDHLIDIACRSVSGSKPANLWLESYSADVIIRNRAIRFGFRHNGSDSSNLERLQKICMGTPVIGKDWKHLGHVLKSEFGLGIPTEAPYFADPDAVIALDAPNNNRVMLKLRALEDLLAPALFALDGRPAVIAPIWPRYAEALFQGSLQPSLLAGKRAGILTEKCYLSSKVSINKIPDHGLIIFYESEGKSGPAGRSAAIAIGRIQRRYLASEAAACNLAQLRGVLSEAEIRSKARGGDLCITEFDHLMKFRKPVPMAKLKEIGCADGAHLVTARPITSEAMALLIKLGEPHA